MEGGDVFVIILSMLTSFVLGMIGTLFFGGRTALNYLVVKASRGKRVLLMAKTSLGWRSFTAKKVQNTLTWKYDNKKQTTSISNILDITRYLRIDMAFVDADKPSRTISLKDGSLYPADFDPQTFNNILIRALTRPNPDGTDDIKKMLTIALILLAIVGFGVLMIYLKVSDLTKGAGGII